MNILKQLSNLEQEASEFGFKWENAKQIIEQIQSELHEIEVHLKIPAERHELQEEIGDLLHAAFSLCLFSKFDLTETLINTVNKFERRFRTTQRLAYEEGLSNLNGQSFMKLMEIWDKSKKLVG